ncbi:MAG: RtcB family protein [Candidatus Omnitrophota bacterium]|nr:RtcB family protein [Candidatus Omnitrophota bacterium]
MSDGWQGPLEKIGDYKWLIPESYMEGMRVPGLIYADEKLLKDIRHDKALQQVANAAFLPGIVKYSLAMPDIHWGYGLPIGGVVATDIEAGGVITPGGVGYDINCGVRLIRTNLTEKDVRPRLDKLVMALFSNVPAGVGSKSHINVSDAEEKKIMLKGSEWAVEHGYGVKEDIEHTEERGSMKGADPDKVPDRAYERGRRQSGTLGSGNHFMEVQVVDDIFDNEAAESLGVNEGQITVMIHTGSRGFGYEICDNYAKNMVRLLAKFDINVPDRQLACVPVKSKEGGDYIAAMKCAANYAWNNRQCLTHRLREVFEDVFGAGWKSLGMSLVWDVAHNIAKFEKYSADGKERLLCIHRKGATRAFGPGHPELPDEYKKTGQPVIIPGDMGRNSYLLLGTKKAEEETFASTCHGAGRLMSRGAAMRDEGRKTLIKDLEAKGIKVMAVGRGTLAEEAPYAYKDVNDVVDVVHNAGLARKVARMRPIGVIKG